MHTLTSRGSRDGRRPPLTPSTTATLTPPLALAFACAASAGCRGPTWQVGPDILAPPRRVASALGDPIAPDASAVDPADVPQIAPPKGVRPCCSFGMDQRISLNGVVVPGFSRPNVVAVEELGAHAYDNGPASVQPDWRGIDLEHNGLVYTCRGGFIDVAHVRDNADMTVYMGFRLARSLPDAITVLVPADGAMRRVLVKPVPRAILAERGRLGAAAILAQWIVYRLSIWHEIASWYGVESVAGFSEKVSTFSLEDAYSNALGVKIGAALVEGQLVRSRDEYDQAMDAWIPASLRRLGAVPREQAREGMRAVDGLWWDSQKVLPDWTMVKKRDFEVTPPLRPWRIEDAVPRAEVPSQLRSVCERAGPPLVLTLPDSLGGQKIEDIVTIEIEPEKWAEKAAFPFPRKGEAKLTSADFPAVMRAIFEDMQPVLGAGFDRPGKSAP